MTLTVSVFLRLVAGAAALSDLNTRPDGVRSAPASAAALSSNALPFFFSSSDLRAHALVAQLIDLGAEGLELDLRLLAERRVAHAGLDLVELGRRQIEAGDVAAEDEAERVERLGVVVVELDRAAAAARGLHAGVTSAKAKKNKAGFVMATVVASFSRREKSPRR